MPGFSALLPKRGTPLEGCPSCADTRSTRWPEPHSRRFRSPSRSCLLPRSRLRLLAHGAIGKPRIAALQAALWDRGHYQSTIDGLRGPLTRGAIRDFQREHGLRVTGRAGAPTVAALGGPARRLQGVAALRKGARGWDVVRLQFLLAWHGFPSGPFDGEFGQRVERATLRFQRWARLEPDAVAGPGTFKALRRPPARPRARLSAPLAWAPGDRFGPRANRFHAGIDLPADPGTSVAAVKAGSSRFRQLPPWRVRKPRRRPPPLRADDALRAPFRVPPSPKVRRVGAVRRWAWLARPVARAARICTSK